MKMFGHDLTETSPTRQPSGRVLVSSARGPGFPSQGPRYTKDGIKNGTRQFHCLAVKYWLFPKNQDRKINVMDKIWDKKSFEVIGVVAGVKKPNDHAEPK